MSKLSPHKLDPQIEMSGGKSPRQRIWEVIRRHRPGEKFTPLMVKDLAKVTAIVVDKYLNILERAGFVQIHGEKSAEIMLRRYNEYTLLKDNGVEAPRFDSEFNLITEASATERMWNTIRRLFKSKGFNCIELAEFASTATHQVSKRTAQGYINVLLEAGYLQCLPTSKAKPQKMFTLLPHMDSGSRAPVMQKTKVVYDPNWDKVVWIDQSGEQDE